MREKKQELVARPHLLPMIFYLQEKRVKYSQSLILIYQVAQEIYT